MSTTEVAAIAQSYPGVADAIVFGVSLPGADGKAGMLALVADAELDLAGLREHLAAHLPRYAVPLFVRTCTELVSTGTFRAQKSDLIREGFRSGDGRTWFDDRRAGTYVPCDTSLLSQLDSGALAI